MQIVLQICFVISFTSTDVLSVYSQFKLFLTGSHVSQLQVTTDTHKSFNPSSNGEEIRCPVRNNLHRCIERNSVLQRCFANSQTNRYTAYFYALTAMKQKRVSTPITTHWSRKFGRIYRSYWPFWFILSCASSIYREPLFIHFCPYRTAFIFHKRVLRPSSYLSMYHWYVFWSSSLPLTFRIFL